MREPVSDTKVRQKKIRQRKISPTPQYPPGLFTPWLGSRRRTQFRSTVLLGLTVWDKTPSTPRQVFGSLQRHGNSLTVKTTAFITCALLHLAPPGHVSEWIFDSSNWIKANIWLDSPPLCIPGGVSVEGPPARGLASCADLRPFDVLQGHGRLDRIDWKSRLPITRMSWNDKRWDGSSSPRVNDCKKMDGAVVVVGTEGKKNCCWGEPSLDDLKNPYFSQEHFTATCHAQYSTLQNCYGQFRRLYKANLYWNLCRFWGRVQFS